MITKTIKMVCLASLLASGLAQAAKPCDGFEIKLKNNLSDDLIIKNMRIEGAEVDPHGLQKIGKQSESVFTVNNSVENVPMRGIITLNTISIPSKNIEVEFTLTNENIVCAHNDTVKTGEGLDATSTRLPGNVTYAIDYKA